MDNKKSSYRGRAYYRKMRAKAIAKKIRKSHYYTPDGYYRYKGKFSKNKIHCSCWLCRMKSYDYPTKTDMNKLIDFEQQLKEYYSETAQKH